MGKRLISKNLLYEVLVDFLPAFQKPYANTKAYNAMCDALMDYLRSTDDDRMEKRQVLEHVKEIFEDMCNTVPSPSHPDPERAWNSLSQ